jgi:hypothetical protein
VIPGAPPGDVAPARLFRWLLKTPRPSISIGPVVGIDAPLRVVGLRSDEVEEVFAEASDPIEVVRVSRRIAGLIALAVRVGDAPLFEAADDVRALYPETFAALAQAVAAGLAVVSPIYGRSAPWDDVLRRGAQDPSNVVAYAAIRSCHDVAIGSRAVWLPRPERYFDLPLHAMTDGQWMAFRAARADIK